MIGYINKALERISGSEECYPSRGWELVPVLRDAWLNKHLGAQSWIEWSADKLGIAWKRLAWRPCGMSLAKAFEAEGFSGHPEGEVVVHDLTSPEGLIGVYFPMEAIAPRHLPIDKFLGWDWLACAPKDSEGRVHIAVAKPRRMRTVVDRSDRFAMLEFDDRVMRSTEDLSVSDRFAMLELT